MSDPRLSISRRGHVCPTRPPDSVRTRSSLLRLNVVTQFSYCMETIIQAGNKRLRIASHPVTTNPKTRESRLFSNIFQHMFKSGTAIVRSFLMFKPHVPLGWMAFLTGMAGVIPFVRFLIFYVMGESAGHIQSLIFGSAMIVASLLSIALLVIADLLKTNRVLIEEQLERTKELEYSLLKATSSVVATADSPSDATPKSEDREER